MGSLIPPNLGDFMWFDSIPDISVSGWLTSAIALFSDTLRTLVGQPVLRIFLVLMLFLALVSLAGALFRQGRNGKL